MGWKKIKQSLRVMGAMRCTSGLTVDAGGITNTASNLTLTAGGVDLPVATGTTAANLPAYGVSIVGGTGSTAGATYTIGTPTVGVEKFIEIRNPSSDAAHIVRASTGGGVTFNGTDHIATVTTAGDGNITMHMVGVTTARWAWFGGYGTLTLSTS